MPTDRHRRPHRSGDDPRRRPSEGFRVASSTRFDRVVRDAVALLPGPLRRHGQAAELVVQAVPPDDQGVVALARFVPGGAGVRARLHVYRRPLELRADSRADLLALVRATIGRVIADQTGLEFIDPEADER